MSPKEQLLERMNEMGVSPKRSLGQNFLVNQNTIEKIVNRATSFMPSKVVEVGPGLGALTERMIQNSSDMILIELDNEFSKYWSKRGLEVVEQDALKVDWKSLKLPPKTLFLSNLPYQISARIVIERSVAPSEIESMVLMFQKEVAQRITAEPKNKDYGFLSVVAQMAWKISKVTEAGPGDFYPKPRVASRVLSFERKREITDDVVKFVKTAFTNRRKMMLKAFGDQKDKVLPHLESLGYNEKVRAEEISPDEFLELTKLMGI